MNKPVLFTLAAIHLVGLPAVAETGRNHFHVQARIGFNLKAEFNQNSRSVMTGDPGPFDTTPYERIYQDGYVRIDSSGNAGGQTWFWGYEDASQIAGDLLNLHSYNTSIQGGSQTETADPMLGSELVYQRDLHVEESFRWGLEGAFGYVPVDIDRQTQGAITVTETIDRFENGGLPYPLAPYRGSFEGPGQLLNATPVNRIVDPVQGTLRQSRELEGDLFNIRIGPYAMWKLFDNLAIGVGGGLSVAPADIDFLYRDRIEAGSMTSPLMDQAGRAGRTEVLWGAWLDGRVAYSFSDQWSAIGALQYQYLTDLEVQVNGLSAQLDPGTMFFLSIGAGYHF